jgi:hypothetical protein
MADAPDAACAGPRVWVLGAEVPLDRLLATSATGFGPPFETEFVLSAGSRETAAPSVATESSAGWRSCPPCSTVGLRRICASTRCRCPTGTVLRRRGRWMGEEPSFLHDSRGGGVSTLGANYGWVVGLGSLVTVERMAASLPEPAHDDASRRASPGYGRCRTRSGPSTAPSITSPSAKHPNLPRTPRPRGHPPRRRAVAQRPPAPETRCLLTFLRWYAG